MSVLQKPASMSASIENKPKFIEEVPTLSPRKDAAREMFLFWLKREVNMKEF